MEPKDRPKDQKDTLQSLATIREHARKLREGSGIPVVESCARWCECYTRIAQWSLGETDRFDFLEEVATEPVPKVKQRIATLEPIPTIERKEPAMEPVYAAKPKPVMSNGNGKKPRWGMAIDLKRCVGCQSCTLACKMENGTPPDVFWMRVMEKEEGKFPAARTVFMPLRCNHCAEPPCVPVCPTGASYVRDKDNLVLIDQNKCIGCRACVVACPYQVRFIAESGRGYYGDRKTPYEATSYQKWQPRTAMKCTFCVHRIDEGLQPACVQTCPTRALVFGDLNDTGSEISQMVRSRVRAQPRAELGTDPSLFYLS